MFNSNSIKTLQAGEVIYNSHMRVIAGTVAEYPVGEQLWELMGRVTRDMRRASEFKEIIDLLCDALYFDKSSWNGWTFLRVPEGDGWTMTIRPTTHGGWSVKVEERGYY